MGSEALNGTPLSVKRRDMIPFTEEERQRADIIYDETLGKISLGFDPDILKVLDDPESSEQEREEIKQKLSQEIVAHLILLANSAYLGKIAVGKIVSFASVILRLGTIYVKIFIIGFGLLALAKDERSRRLLAKSFSAAVVGKLLAEQLNWKKEYVQQVEVCCLFSEIGKILLFLYENMQDAPLTADFIERYHLLMAQKIVERFELPEYIGKSTFCVFGETSLNYTHNSLSTEGAVMMAYATVNYIFSREQRLAVRSPMPNASDAFVFTPGKAIYNYLSALSMSNGYLRIIAEKS
jgi:hypothetical protein